jgi:archaellum component FlaC
MSNVNNKNFAAIEQAMNILYKDYSAMNERMTRLENNLTILRAELANQKALTAHVLGRGMGSTVK